MASKREQVAAKIQAVLAAALPAAEVNRNGSKAERLPDGGLVTVRDGEPGEPEVTLSPLTYTYNHVFALDVASPLPGPGVSDETALDAFLALIGAAVEADRTLGGLCEWAEPVPGETGEDVEIDGAEARRAASIGVLAIYSTRSPLG